jgi:hypothetical protein
MEIRKPSYAFVFSQLIEFTHKSILTYNFHTFNLFSSNAKFIFFDACYLNKKNYLISTRVARCGGCDTLFPSLMLLEHHKEEYEHWSDSEEYQSGTDLYCRRNRRNDYEFSDSEVYTSDAESEDLERLL